MQKKLIAVAVAGVLGAPAVALAQTSTVNIYGNITYEYGHVDQGAGQPSTDYADNPGGSAIGFRGEEKLGGGLSAWFQCETSVDVRGVDGNDADAASGWCTRNSAIGFKGGFGNLHFGRWDTPMKRALNQGSTGGLIETGILGTSFVAWGGSGGVTTIRKTNRQRWKRRDAALTYYESPRFSGFQVLAAFSPGNGAVDQGAVDGDTNAKPRIWSFAGLYNNGPLAIGLGYERHNEMAALGAADNFDDRGWGISAAYTFAKKIEVGATYLDAEYETAIGRTLKRRSWTVGVEWNVAGPHTVLAFYGNADDAKGNSLVSVGDVPASGSDTGAQDWSIGYRYAFSKRTWIQAGFHRTDNDRNAFYKNGNANKPLLGGEKQDGIAFHLRHRF